MVSETTITSSKPKHFCIHVADMNGRTINVRLPYFLFALGAKFGTIVSREVAQAFKDRNLDFANLGNLPEDELVRALHEGITISTSGEIVRIFCE